MLAWLTEMLDEYKHIKYTCPVCHWSGEDNYDSYIKIADFNFCPNCADRKKNPELMKEDPPLEEMDTPDRLDAIYKALIEDEPEMTLRSETVYGVKDEE